VPLHVPAWAVAGSGAESVRTRLPH
jgi:hypothetical protein